MWKGTRRKREQRTENEWESRDKKKEENGHSKGRRSSG